MLDPIISIFLIPMFILLIIFLIIFPHEYKNKKIKRLYGVIYCVLGVICLIIAIPIYFSVLGIIFGVILILAGLVLIFDKAESKDLELRLLRKIKNLCVPGSR